MDLNETQTDLNPVNFFQISAVPEFDVVEHEGPHVVTEPAGERDSLFNFEPLARQSGSGDKN